jgi:hypothetical protein
LYDLITSPGTRNLKIEIEIDASISRYADTEILIQEFTNNPPQSDRVLKALARVNYIHSGYQKAGKISNADMLYTLSVFITEPITWVKKYEWREMTDMELCAIGVLVCKFQSTCFLVHTLREF